MSRLLRTLIVYCLLLLLAGCSGGGCSGCAGGAIQPIAGGYPLTPERRIPHAMQIRLTEQGAHSIEAIAPGLLGSFVGSGFDIPPSQGDQSGFYFNICQGSPCHLSVELPTSVPAFQIGFAPTDALTVHIRLIVHGDVQVRGCPHLGCSDTCSGTFCVRTSLTINVDTRRPHSGGHDYIGMQTNVRLQRDSHAERNDYLRADLVSPTGSGDAVQEAPNEGIENEDIDCTSGTLCFVVNLIRGTIVGQFRSQFAAVLGPIQDALAASSAPPGGCPTGTTVDGTHCRYPDNTLVPMLLGTDGTGNFGRLLGSITPGVRADASYVIGAGDHNHGAEVADTTGMTVNVFGAVTSNGHNSCVPRVTPPAIPDIPEWHTLRQNNVPGSTTPTDLGIGVSEEFMNSALFNLWDSGMFCLGVTTHMSQQLSTGLFSALPQLASLRNVVFPGGSSAIALVLRPQQAPTVRIDTGADLETHPLMRLTFTQLAIDFYAWSEERYVRFMTVTTDLSMPINLATDMGGSLRPTLGMATTMNTVVTNTQLLSAMPAQLAGVLGPLLGTAIGMFAGNIPAITVPSIPLPGAGGTTAGSVQIQIPASGIQGVDESGSRFLGLFANLAYVASGSSMENIELDTQATAEVLPFDHDVYQFRAGFTSDQLPHVRLHLSVPNTFGHDVEYAYRVDDLTWSQWTRESTVDVVSDSFVAQGNHHVDVRARVVDAPNTVDTEPTRIVFTIDTIAPTASVARQGDQLVIDAHDDVLAPEHLHYSASFDGGASTSFANDSHIRIPAGATHYEVRVRDDSGNEVHLSGEISVLTIRGGESTDPSSGCGCSTPGAHRDGTTGMLAAVVAAIFALSLLRRRSRGTGEVERVAVRVRARSDRRVPRILLWAMVPSFFVALGCDCGANMMTDAGGDACAGGGQMCGGRCVPMTGDCSSVCESYQTATGMPTLDPATCTWQANATACACQDNPALSEGMAGSHLDMAVASDNTVWMSSYSAGDPRGRHEYGDLVVGRYDRAMSRVNWTHVDGVPSGTPTAPPSGWRGGISEPGDDVGRWNSLQLDSAGHPRVAYWDTTHDHLKYAYNDGTMWHVSTVDTAGHNGRYASLVLLANDVPAIAYRATVADPMNAGHILGKVRFARASSATPNGATDWTITDVASAATSCRAADCDNGQVCLQDTGVCAAMGTGCASACAAGQACVMGTCQATLPSNWIEDVPPGIGLFNSLRTDSSGAPQLVYYDRDRGNLMGARLTGSTWSTFIIDGETAAGADISDRGMWATLTVAADGTWHVAYVDGWTEDLLYIRVQNGAAMGPAETIDDGSAVAMTPFDDGDHVLGDSADIDISTTGTIRVVYQDSTAGTLRIATRDASGWTTSVQDMTNSTGYWSRIDHGTVATFYRDLSTSAPSFGVRLFSAP